LSGGFQIEQLFNLVSVAVSRFQELNIEELIMLASSPYDPEYKKVAEMVMTGNDIDQIGQQYIVIPLKYAVVCLLGQRANATPTTDAVEEFVAKTEGSIITFNWDVLFDAVLNSQLKLDWLNTESNLGGERKYLKLHGSADCLYCLNCKEAFRVDIRTLVAKWTESNYSCPYCGSIESHGIETRSYASEPLIIGFSSDKSVELARIPILQSQWNLARQELIDCDELLVYGFSFNTIDKHVLFFLDSVLRMRKKDLIVQIINPDNSTEFRRKVRAAFSGDPEADAPSHEFTVERYDHNIEVTFRSVDFTSYVSSL
jgi:NAD-dependent SIR2 family protein deacetylase